MASPQTAQKKRGGDTPDPEILRLATITAGILAEIFEVDKRELLDRPRPSGHLRNVRDLLIGVLHFHFCFHTKTGEIARRSPATTGKNWMLISQQRIAAALGRDRGVISDAAHGVDEAATGDVGVCTAIAEVTETIADVVAQSAAWREALRQEALEQAIRARAAERAHEAAVLERVEADVIADQLEHAAPKATIPCHQCRRTGKVRVHSLGGDPAYRHAWQAAQQVRPSADGFHELTCRFCDGKGERPSKSATASGAAILSASGE